MVIRITCVSVLVYVNPSKACDAYLKPGLVAGLPSVLGPGPINKVLQQCIQACVDCASQTRLVIHRVTEGNGKLVITGKCHTIGH